MKLNESKAHKLTQFTAGNTNFLSFVLRLSINSAAVAQFTMCQCRCKVILFKNYNILLTHAICLPSLIDCELMPGD